MQAYKDGNVSPRAVPRRVRVPWLAPRESEARAGAIGRICVVGKPSTISNSSTSRSILIVAELSSCFGALHPACCLPTPPQQGAHLGRLLCAGQIRSGELGLLKSNGNTAAVRSIHKPFGCNDFSRSVCDTALTKGFSGRNITPHIARSRCAASAELPNWLGPRTLGEEWRGLRW